MKACIYFRDNTGKLRTLSMAIDSISDVLIDISKQRVFADYITENTGIKVASPILAIVK